jgi:hypothetical protein
MNTQTTLAGVRSKRPLKLRTPDDRWSPDEMQRFLICATACLCLILYLVGTFWLIARGIVKPDALGALAGAGILGFGGMLVAIFRLALRR